MYKQLSSGVKISITRSISFTYEAYMASIGWDEKKYDFNDFIAQWQNYVLTNAAWYDKVPQDILRNPKFQEELANKINEVIMKLLSQEPTEKQVAKIEAMQKELGTSYEYGCKAEATYVEQLLQQAQQ